MWAIVNYETHLMEYYTIIKLLIETEAMWKVLSIIMLCKKEKNVNIYT